MATIYVENKPYTVEDGQNLLQACLQLGFNLPYFCWHPALHSIGACRQCAVKQFRDEHDTRGRIVMACMTPALEGTRISITDAEAQEFRAEVIAWLMINHPHDCPVCDEGGECHLQDMTVMTGHDYRKYRFRKRTYRNQYLGPFVSHEMNRCIQCYRCVRFYGDYAGGHDLAVFAAHDHVYFGRERDGVLESEFAGNLVEVCPTGVFTDATLRHHYTRKWDLQTAPSVCGRCGLGCNIFPGERYGTLRRIQNRYNGDVNGYFLCDRGRYGYEAVNSPRRIRQPLCRPPGQRFAQATAVPKSEALESLRAMLSGSGAVIGIGSPRASLEANFALRTLVGPERFYLGVSAGEWRLLAAILDILQRGPARTPSLREVGACDAVFVLGEDVTNTAPMLALAIRQAIRQQPLRAAESLHIAGWDDAALRAVIQDAKGPLFTATVCATKLDEVATRTYYASPDDLARLGFAVAAALDAPGQPPFSLADEERGLAESIAQALRAAERPLVVAGTSLGNEAIVQAAANVAWALCAAARPARLCYIVPEGNTLGLALMGGGSLEQAFTAVANGGVDAVVILENDLYRRADATAVDTFLASARLVVALDSVANATTDRADFVLPAASFAEADGTLVNNEGRAQRFFQVFVPEGEIQESWRWLRELMLVAGRPEAAAWARLDDVVAAMSEAIPALQPVVAVAPDASFRIAGLKIPRQPQRYSGRTAIHANVEVSEQQPPDDPDTALSFSMEGYDGQPPSALIPRLWAPGWNSVQALNKFQSEIGGPLRGGDPGRRLIEVAPGQHSFFGTMPATFERRSGEWLLIPLYHIFGSEELSMLTPGIAELAPRPYIALNPEDAALLGLRAGQELSLILGGRARLLAVRLLAELPGGVAGLPAGLPDLLGVDLPAWTRIAAVQPKEREPGH